MDQQQVGKRKYSVIDDRQQNGNDLSFERPKSLEKRKRAETIGTVSNKNSSTNGCIIEDNSQKEGRSRLTTRQFLPRKKMRTPFLCWLEVMKQKRMASACNATLQPVPSKLEADNVTIVKSGVDQELEAYEQKVEFDSEHDGGEEFDLYDGDHGDGEGEYIDDDDDDEFAKKMGVMYS